MSDFWKKAIILFLALMTVLAFSPFIFSSPPSTSPSPSHSPTPRDDNRDTTTTTQDIPEGLRAPESGTSTTTETNS